MRIDAILSITKPLIDKWCTSMSIRSSLKAWDEAQSLFDNDDLIGALDKLQEVSDSQKSAKILYNIGGIQLLLNEPDRALLNLDRCIEKDPHLAIAYCQRGIVQYRLNRFKSALSDFEVCLVKLRDNKMIDYKQLGLRHKLYSCEVMYNIASTLCQLNNFTKASETLQTAIDVKVESKHTCIQSKHTCIQEGVQRAQLKQVFPLMELKKESVFFRPAKTKTANLGKKDYLGKAKVITSVEEKDNFSGFVGPRLLEAGKLSESKSLPNSPIATRRVDVNKPTPRSRTPQPPVTSKPIDSSSHVKPPVLILPDNAPDVPPPRPPKKSQPVNQKMVKPTPRPPRPAAQGDLSKPLPRPRSSQTLTVTVDCLGTHTLQVKSDIRLQQLEQMVCHQLGYQDGTLALWVHPTDREPYIIDSDYLLHQLCHNSDTKHLKLSGYSRR